MFGGGVDAATLVAALGAGPPPPECRWGRRPHAFTGGDVPEGARVNSFKLIRESGRVVVHKIRFGLTRVLCSHHTSSPFTGGDLPEGARYRRTRHQDCDASRRHPSHDQARARRKGKPPVLYISSSIYSLTDGL